MLTRMQHNANGLPYPFPSLAALLAEPFPHTPQEMVQLGVPGVISGNFSVGEIATTSPLVARHDYI
jgi:hypothetical protein